MDSNKIRYASFVLYCVCLILPVKGVWFGGAKLMVFSGFFAVVGVGSLVADPDAFNISFGLIFIFLPFFNISYLWVLYRFRQYEALVTPSSVALFVSTILAFTYGVVMVVAWREFIYPYILWCFALLVLSVALFYKWRYE